jgi:hypothetical protein
MVKRRKIVRTGGAKPAAVAPKVSKKADPEDEFEEVDETVVDDEEYDDDDAVEEIDDEDDEEEAPAPVRKAKRVVAVEADEEDPDDQPVVVKKSKPAPVAAPKAAEIKMVEATVVENVFTKLIEALDEGKAIIITKTKSNQYQVVSGDAVKFGGQKMSNAEYWKEVISPEFREWNEEWSQMTFDERKKEAIKIKAKWEPHEDPGIEGMHIAQAVRAKLGIEKYKPEYRTRAQRAALRHS